MGLRLGLLRNGCVGEGTREQNCGRVCGINVVEGGKTRCGSEGGLLRGKEKKAFKSAWHTDNWARRGECGHYCDSEVV